MQSSRQSINPHFSHSFVARRVRSVAPGPRGGPQRIEHGGAALWAAQRSKRGLAAAESV